MALIIGGGISIGGQITIEPKIPIPTVPTLGIWTFDPSFTGPGLSLTNSNKTVYANDPEASLSLGLMDGSVSLYDIAAKVMYTVHVDTEDPGDVIANAAHIGFSYQYVDLTTPLGDDGSGYGIGWCQNGTVHYAGGVTATGLPTYTYGDYLDIAVNIDTGLFWVRVNGGLWNGSGTADPATGTSGINLQMPGNGTAGTSSALYPAVNPGAFSDVDSMTVQAFTYSIPSGFTAI